MAGAAWTPATEALLTRLWTVDSLSYGDIAAALSSHTGSPVTRNAVAGRVRKLGLVGKGAPERSFAAPVSQKAAPSEAPFRDNSAAESVLTGFGVGVPETPPTEPGTWRLADHRAGQCRFACTPHSARPEAHRFCGQPTRVGPGNLHGSWCPEHLPLVWSGAKTAGGRSMADAERERSTAQPAHRGSGSTRVA